MSTTSLYTAVSGMNATGLALSVVGDNIANMNTHGFKGSSVVFGDIVSQSLGSAGIGRGVQMTGVSAEFTQGAFENSSNVMDMSVDGEGLFVLSDGIATLYSRAGQFGIDKQGYAVNPDGYKLQGFGYSSTTGAATTVLGDINVSSVSSEPAATSAATIYTNLNSTDSIPNDNFSVGAPEDTSNFTSTVTVYDSLGTGHVLNTYFRKSAEAATGNTWQWFTVVSAADAALAADEIQAQGTLTFTNTGALNTESGMSYVASSASGGFDFNGGAAAGQQIALDFGTNITTENGTGLGGSTQFGATSTTSYLYQNGYSAGSLKNVSISDDGIITGIFTNGQTKNVAQIVLAKFISVEGLTKMGNNLYAESFDSGQPIVTAAGNTGTGNVLSNTLELSTVDLASEFVKMIIMQRGFQANSRMVSTADELMMELVNLKR